MRVLVKRALVVSVVVMLAACGGGGGGDSKDLFSIWTRDGDGGTFDLSSAQFGTENYMTAFTRDGTQCICRLAIIGTQDKGTMALNSCISSPYNSSKNRQCEQMNGTGNYTNADAVLTLSGSNGTATFR